MRSLYFTAAESGMTRSQLRWGEATGRWRSVARVTYRHGPEDPTLLDESLGLLIAEDAVGSGTLAGVLYGLDSVKLIGGDVSVPPNSAHKRAKVRRRTLRRTPVEVAGFACTDGFETLIDLAACLDDDVWEQALESALRKNLVTIAELEAALGELGRARTPGVARMRRVLTRRPDGAAATESLLETLMIQLIRLIPSVDDPLRQFVVRDEAGEFVARVDLAWPEPLYDAHRETAVIAATGWLVGRFTWDEVVRYPMTTARRLAALIAQARRRALPAAG
jgi:hypothetical protein